VVGGTPPLRKIRVLHVLEAIDGGTKRHVLAILASLDRERFEAEVAGPSIRPETQDGETFVADLAAQGTCFHHIEMRRAVHPRDDLVALWRLCRLIRRGRYDVVHGHSSKAGFLARVAGWLTRRPTLYTPNGLYFLRLSNGWRRSSYVALERIARPFTTRFVAVSESERDAALREKLASRERIVVIPSGVEPEAFARPAHARAHVRAELEIPLDAVVVGTVSRMTHQKDPACLVRAMREVIGRTKRPVYLVWVGDGALAEDVARLVSEYRLDSSCRLLGVRRDVRAVMCAFDVFALTSRYEGLPYAVLEAMALGLPVVATDVVGTRDVVANGINGYLVPPENPAAVADALLRVIENDNLRAELGQRARKLVADRFTLDDMVRPLEALYEELVNGLRTRPDYGLRTADSKHPEVVNP
jgi:glycosyltransferase involved in cell wall biosynthesis